MPISLPKRPNVRHCTHIKVTGQQCGSPALRGEFFCYFHTRVIKGVQQRVDMRLHSMALLEDCESIQLSIMHVVDGLVKGTLDPTRARLIIQALRIAARNAKNVRFDDVHYRPSEQPMVRQVPDYARQYLIEHPEIGPPISEECAADAPVHDAKPTPAQGEAQAEPPAAKRQPTAQALGKRQKPIELRGSERTLAIHLRRTSYPSKTRRNTPGSCKPKPRSPVPWQATGAISAPSSNSPASADKAKTSRLEPTARVLRLVALSIESEMLATASHKQS
jgi:hypothetical protein